jgi:hypothetical protein
MLKTEVQDHDINGDPAPNVASDADIEIAERLRRQLEERYLVGFAAPAPSKAIPSVGSTWNRAPSTTSSSARRA